MRKIMIGIETSVLKSKKGKVPMNWSWVRWGIQDETFYCLMTVITEWVANDTLYTLNYIYVYILIGLPCTMMRVAEI